MDKAKIAANRKKLAARMKSNKLGGKGSIRRKKKVQHKATNTEDKSVQKQLKKLGGQPLSVEQVNLFKNNGEVIHFKVPKVQAAVQSNMFVISGANNTQSIQDLLPEILTQLGADDIGKLRSLAQQMQAQQGLANLNLGGANKAQVEQMMKNMQAQMQASANAGAGDNAEADSDDDDDDIPDLVEDFETTAAN
eukprot:g2953.t1